MDQFPFEFKITVIGLEVDDFINLLIHHGWDQQADDIEKQFNEQLSNPSTQ